MLVVPPDPPQMMIKVDQVRRVIETIYFRPPEARERVFIFTDAAFMKEAANSLLKILEEPPEFATIFILAGSAGRATADHPLTQHGAAVAKLSPTAEIEHYLEKHRPEWKAPQRALVARLSEGAVGRAQTFDLAAYSASREHALTILQTALKSGEHSELFKITETYRAGAEGRVKLEALLRSIYSLLQDLLFLDSGAPEFVRNTDIVSELQKLGESATFEWLTSASERLAEVERGMRRNLLRSLSLDAMEAAMEIRTYKNAEIT